MEELRYPIGRYQKPEAFTPELKRQWLAVLEALPRWMDACIENLDAAQLQEPYRPEGWTVAQVIHHVADSHMNAYVRMKLALTEENPQIKPYDEAAWAQLPDVELVPVNISVTLLHALHRRMVTLLQHIPDADWYRTYYHPDHKRNIPLWEAVAMYAWHSRHHTEHISWVRERMNW